MSKPPKPLLPLRVERPALRVRRCFSLAIVIGLAPLLVAASATAEDDLEIERSALYPLTPEEWARAFAAATSALDVANIVALSSDQATVFYNNGDPQLTQDKGQQEEGLSEFYRNFRAQSKGIAADDFSITQFSNDFAFVRYTWEVTQLEDGKVLARLNSSYLLRLEQDGWRSIGVIEQGPPSGPNGAARQTDPD